MLVIAPRISFDSSKCLNGFTMVELIFVMVIMGVLGAVGIPRLASYDSQNRAIAEQLRVNLRYAQRLAASRNRDVCVAVTATAITFRMASSAGTAVACPATSVVTPYGDSGGTLDIVLPGATTFSPAGSFRFTPSGTLRNNAGGALTMRTIALTHSGGTVATMSIEPENGYVLSSIS